jgi:hypothetical protein
MNLTFLTQFIDASKIGGWVRGAVAAGFVMLIAKYPVLSSYISPELQTELAAALATVAIGLWSQLTKTDKAKVQAAAGVIDPTTGKPTIVVTSAALAAATPNQENIVSHQDVKVVSQ